MKWILALALFFLAMIPFTFSSGWHIASEVLSGEFPGSYNFSNGINIDGNIGIGTTSPSQKLEVNGSINISNVDGVIYFSDGTNISTAPSSGSGIPTGAVLPFNLSSCPDGWSDFSAAVGRTVVGSGTYSSNSDDDGSNSEQIYSEGETGGRIDHVLTTGQMPSHTHSTSTFVSSPTQNFGGGGEQYYTGGGSSSGTGSAGSNQAHENRMPYIALKYCVKD